MLYQTQAEINAFYVSVIQRVASRPSVDIQDWEMKSTAELLDEMSLIAPLVHAQLLNFLQAYQAWYDVHVGIDEAGTAGNLTNEQTAALNSAIEARDATRAKLLATIR